MVIVAALAGASPGRALSQTSAPDQPARLERQALQFLRVGEFARAEPLLRKLVEQDSSSGQNWYYLGFSLLGRYRLAPRELKILFSRGPREPWLAVYLSARDGREVCKSGYWLTRNQDVNARGEAELYRRISGVGQEPGARRPE